MHILFEIFHYFLCSRQKVPWQAISGFILSVLHASLAAHTKWLIQELSSSPLLHPLPLMVKSDRGRLQMENKELPSEEKAIMVWPDVQPNAKNSISHQKKKTTKKNTETKQNKRPPIPSPFVMAWLLPSGSNPPACQQYHYLFFECCERGARSRVNGKKVRTVRTCHKHESSSTVISHPIFPRLFL